MTIIMTDGFEKYNNTASTDTNSLNLSKRYTVGSSSTLTSYISVSADGVGYNGIGKCLYSNSNTNAGNRLTYPLSSAGISSLTTICVGFHFLATDRYESLIQLQNSNATAYIALNLNLNYKLSIFTNANANTIATVGNEEANVFPLYQWLYVELRVVISGTTADVFVYRDNQLVITLTGLAWYGSATGTQDIQSVLIGKSPYGTNSGSNQYYDNFYITNNERLGPVMMETLLPNEDTAQKQWTPFTGTSNYAMVGEPTNPTIGSSYVQAATVGFKDYYGLTDPRTYFSNYDVLAVTPFTFGLATTATESMATWLTDGVSTYTTAPSTLLTATSLYNYSPLATNPLTSSSWTYADLQSLQIGPEKTA